MHHRIAATGRWSYARQQYSALWMLPSRDGLLSKQVHTYGPAYLDQTFSSCFRLTYKDSKEKLRNIGIDTYTCLKSTYVYSNAKRTKAVKWRQDYTQLQ